MQDPSYDARINILGGLNVYESAFKTSVKKIIFASSGGTVYGDQEAPFTESMTPKPIDPYGIAKEAAERVLITLADTHSIEWVIAVPHSIYGPRQKYDDPYRNVVSIMANLMLQGRQPIIYGDGEQMRCFSYITDCVDSLAAMATNENVIGEIINIGPDEEFISINQLAEKLANITGINLNPVYMPDRPGEVKLATCSSDKIRKLLGYETKVYLDDGLRELVTWIKESGPTPFEYHFHVEIKNDLTPKTWTERLI